MGVTTCCGVNAAAISEDRRKHLEFIQAAVSRMASASSTAKSWLLPVATAAYGYALTKHRPTVALLGVAAVLLFASLDAQYLRQERAFRALYKAAVDDDVDLYDMATNRYYGKANGDQNDTRQENCRMTRVLWSWSLGGFYLPLAVLGLGISLVAACQP